MFSKSILTFCFLVVIAFSKAASDFNCQPGNGDAKSFPREVCSVNACGKKIKQHIKEELNAAFSYMYLAARFDQDSVNRPGMAKFLYESASEERQHAIHMLNYLNMRGIPFDEDFKFNIDQVHLLQDLIKDLNYKSALETALNMEIDVTNKIYQIIDVCADDFHGADEFTGDILSEQHEGVRKLQGAIKAFNDLSQGHSDNPTELSLAEYIFDIKMLKGEF